MKEEGFSLVELLVVVAILGVLSISSVVYINTSSVKLKSFVFNTKAMFNLARYEAVKRSRHVCLDFDYNNDGEIDDNGTVWVAEDVIGTVPLSAVGGARIYTGGAAPQRAVTGSTGNTIDDGVVATDWSGNDTNRLCFNGGGDSYMGAVYLSRENSEAVWEISVNAVGRIKVKQWHRSTGWIK
ncbi:MAG: GspH/FimT family pseudopilin [Gammaproteobacteria bacterium]|nr:GspH/FimT family pseudopilin [Gammaproteobacteria bacterium]